MDSGIPQLELTDVGRSIHGPTSPGGATPCSRLSPLAAAERAEAVALIADGREGRHSVELPERLRTRDWESVLSVMLGVNARLGWPTAGWKVGAASEEVRRIEGMPSPSPGRLYQDRIFASAIELPAELFINYRETECEFAFRLGRDLPVQDEEYSEAEVAAAVESAFPVLEVGDMVFRDWYGASGYFGPSLDNGGGGVLVRGDPVADWESQELAKARVVLRLNRRPVKVGFGRAAMGHPLTSLTWMVNWARGRGIGLSAKEIISTGTCTGHCFVAEGDHVVGDFGPFGKVEVVHAQRQAGNSKGPSST